VLFIELIDLADPTKCPTVCNIEKKNIAKPVNLWTSLCSSKINDLFPRGVQNLKNPKNRLDIVINTIAISTIIDAALPRL
jgi:hypothetical protein